MSTNDNKNLSSTERIKMASDGLLGTLKESLRDELTSEKLQDRIRRMQAQAGED